MGKLSKILGRSAQSPDIFPVLTQKKMRPGFDLIVFALIANKLRRKIVKVFVDLRFFVERKNYIPF